MKYTEEMILRSESGFCMPFEERDKSVELSLGYGKQKHPVSGEEFFHHGLDFRAKNYLLSALATGVVAGIGSDSTHGIYQVIRYGKYEVTYSHLANVYVNFGQPVKAGMFVALSGDLLHLEVKFNGEEIDPIEFITMLYGNIKVMEQNGSLVTPEFENFDMTMPTDFDSDKNEIEQLMMQFLPTYMQDLHYGKYVLPERTEQSLRNIFSVSASKGYFFESMPSFSNPLGIGQKAMPLVCKVQNLLIADFLNYLALRHNVYLSSMNDALKKKPMTQP
jgi:Membrane proteins related to metalloendopeptidases